MKCKQARGIPDNPSHCKRRNVDNLQACPFQPDAAVSAGRTQRRKAKETLHILYSVEFLRWPVSRLTNNLKAKYW